MKLAGRLALFLLGTSLVLNGVLWLATPQPYKETALHHTWEMLHGHSADDSWVVMQLALDQTRAGATGGLYEELFFKRKIKFQYPPSSLFALIGMQQLAGPQHVRTSRHQTFESITTNDVLAWLFVLITAAATAVLLQTALRRSGREPGSPAAMALRAALVIGAALTFYPIVKAYTLGQIQVWVNGLFALALLCWVTGYRLPSGVLMGLAALIKPHYGLVLVWALLRREWWFSAGCAATIGVGLAASVAVFGWADHIDYLRVLSFVSQHGETYYPNQTVNGLLNRLVNISGPAAYQNLVFKYEFPPFNAWVYAGTLATSLVLLATALWRRRTASWEAGSTIDFCIMAVSLTLASPIAWEHHYGIFLPVFAVLLANTIGDIRRLVWLAAAYVLVGTFIPASNHLAGSTLNLAQSYQLAGGLIVLVLLHTARRDALALGPGAVRFGTRSGQMGWSSRRSRIA